MTKASAALALVLAPVLASGASKESALRGAHQREVVGRRVQETGGDYTHLGCFGDVKDDRVMKLAVKDRENMTPGLCFDTCSKQGAAYFATQFGTECWCTTDAGEDYSRHGAATCDTWCAGDSSTTCGGRNAFEVYSLNLALTPHTNGYVGCYNDMKDDRVFIDKFDNLDGMTPEVCLGHCELEGKASGYYAIQFGYECWCGLTESAEDYSRHGNGTCAYPCSGDKTVSCGGYNTFDLFHYDNDVTAPSPTPTSEPDAPNPAPTAVPADDDPMMLLMGFHNAVRCVHNAEPLEYDAGLALAGDEVAKGMATEASCGVIEDDVNTGFGINVFACASNDADVPCFDPPAAMSEFYGSQVGGGPPENWGPHAIQMLWKSTTKMGCGLQKCSVGEMHYDVLVCRYEKAADADLGDIGVNVDYQVKSFQECGYTRT